MDNEKAEGRREKKVIYDAYWGEDKITHFRGSKQAIINRLNRIQKDLIWVDSLVITERGNTDNELYNANSGMNNFFSLQEYDQLFPTGYQTLTAHTDFKRGKVMSEEDLLYLARTAAINSFSNSGVITEISYCEAEVYLSVLGYNDTSRIIDAWYQEWRHTNG